MADDNIRMGIDLVPKIDPSTLASGISQIQGQFNKLKIPDTLKKSLTAATDAAMQSLKQYQDKASQPPKNGKTDSRELERLGTKLQKDWEAVRTIINQIESADLQIKFDNDDRIKEKTEQLKEFRDLLDQEVSAHGLKTAAEAIDNISKVSKSKEIQNFFDAFKAGDISGAETALENLTNNLVGFGKNTGPVKEAIKTAFEEMKNGSKTTEQALTDLKNKLDNLGSSDKGITALAEKVSTYIGQLQQLKTALDSLKGSGNLEETRGKIAEIGAAIESIQTEIIKSANDELEGSKSAADGAAGAINKYRESTEGAYNAQANLNKEIGQLKNRIEYFFGLTNAVRLFRQALQNTFNTVKELDKSMTETAVVTDFTVGDMWNQLPQYTATAKEFGATIKGVYDVMTLYYQQGLDQDTAWALGTETLKLARIAGLDYAEATDRRHKSYAA